MKTETENFRAANTAEALAPRYVASLSFSDASPNPLHNLITYSEQLDNAAWSFSGTATANTDVAPDGTTTADKLDDVSAAATARALQSFTFNSIGRQYRFSIYVKRDSTARSTRYPRFALRFTQSSPVVTEMNTVKLDTSTGEIDIDFDDPNGSAVLQVFDANWYRLTIIAGPVATGIDGAAVWIEPAAGSSGSWSESVAATGDIRVWGAQVAYADADLDYLKTEATVDTDGILDVNLLTYSEAFDNSDWTKTSSPTTTADDATAPDGTTTADKLDDTTGVFASYYQQPALEVAERYTASIFIKKDSTGRATRFPMLRLQFSGSTTEQNDLRVDTATGEFLIDGFNVNPAAFGGVISIDADWWLAWITTSSDDQSNNTLRFAFYPSAGGDSAFALGATPIGFVHAWGAQLSESLPLINYVSTGSAAAAAPRGSDIDQYFLTSHDDALLPSTAYSWDSLGGSIVDISGQSQRISPDKAQHTIGNIKLRIADVDGKLSARIYQRLISGEGLRRKRVKLYKGHESLTDFDDYSLRLTYLVDDVTYQDGVYTLTCSDVQRTEKTEIFDLHQGVLTSTVNATATSIPITIANAAEKFPLLEHDANYGSDASKTVGYIQIDDEIIRHTGWDGTNTNLLVDGASGRGALNTTAATHTVTASVDDQKKKVVEYVYIEMAVPRLIYALLTGKIENQVGNMPAHWHCGISTQLVRLTDYISDAIADLWNPEDGRGRMAKIQGAEITQAKEFIERELLLWCGGFMPVYATGELGFKRFQNILPRSSYLEELRDVDVIKYGALQFDQKAVINNMVVQYNYLPVLERYTKTVQLLDADSISKYGKTELKVFQFQALFSGRHALDDVYQYFDLLRDRYAAPPARLKVDVMPEYDRLDVGDTVRLELEQIHDYNVDGILSRTFEIQQIRTNWKTGIVSLDLFGGIERASKNALASSAVMNSSFYTADGTELSTVLTMSGGSVTASGTLNGNSLDHGNAVYYYSGDLTINSGVTVTINKNVQLRVNGFITCNGKIDGDAQGFAGAPATSEKKGRLGTQGRCGISQTYPGCDFPSSGFRITKSAARQRSAGPFFNSFNGLNIVNPDGLSLEGIPKQMQGTSGASGDGAADDGSYQAAGGAGGASGAGLVVICKGFAFGASGSMDLSGADGGSPNSFVPELGITCYAGAGQGGFPGAVLFLLDGNVEAPLTNSITLLAGDTPIPSVDNHWPVKRLAAWQGTSNAWYKQFSEAWDFSGNIGIYYLPAAENGYEWTAADEIQEAANLAFQLA